MPSCAFLLDFLEKKRRQEGKERRWIGWEGKQYYALILQGALWDKPFSKGKGQRDKGGSCLLVPSYWTFLRKKKTRSRGNRGRRREGMQGYALGTLCEKPFRKGMGASDRRISCLLGPSYWTFLRKKKTRGKGRKWIGWEGKQDYALLLQGTLCYKPCWGNGK